jgi:hypothetical protein
MIDKLPEPLAKAALEDWESSNKVQRLWACDGSLSANADEGQWRGWLGIVGEQIKTVDSFRKVAQQIRDGGFAQSCGRRPSPSLHHSSSQ